MLRKVGFAIGIVLCGTVIVQYGRRVIRKIRGPPEVPLLGNIPQLLSCNYPLEYLQNCQKKYGTYYVLNLGVYCHMLSDPEDIQAIYKNTTAFPERDPHTTFNVFLPDGLLALPTEKIWKAHRTTFSQLFSDKFLAQYYEGICSSADEYFAQWKANGGTKDLLRDMTTLSLLALGISVLGVRPSEEFVSFEGMKAWLKFIDAGDTLPWWMRKSSLVPYYKEASVSDRKLTTFAQNLIEKARKGELNPYCLLSVAVNAKHDDGTPWSESEILSEVKTFLLAGHETTSNTLTFVLHLLAVNPHVQEKARALLRAHLKQVGTDTPREYDHVKSLDYLWAIFREGLRLYPTVPLNGRYCVENIQFGPYYFKRGEYVLLDNISIAHSAEYFENPQLFLPERWLDDELRRKPDDDPYNIVRNFGGGRRVCIGMRFAEEEVISVVAKVLMTFEVSPGDESTKVSKLPLSYAVTLSAENPINLTMKPLPM